MKKSLILLLVVFMCGLASCATRVRTKAPTKVVVVQKRPANYKVVKIKGKRYYFWNGKHYTKTRRGYVVVKV
ncbi:DUF6515 family protein [Maribacter aestuarii]|uniref:DUF6515 family protein n=1 Tax=Maribacter aestuarii TaxID=1130723 RepID=UPI00248CC6C8|nr:DUF6515 family protein [Maribacter aestuarii]